MPQATSSSVPEPQLAEEFTVAALDAEVRRDLRGLQKDTADTVARHLVAAGSLVGEDPALALAHARYARKRASRIAVVREAAGITAYHAGEWAEALAELRAARRMGGGPLHLPVMADIERALGRPERAVDIARGPEAAELGTAGRIELAIVGAGARRDLGEIEASVIALQLPELDPARRDPWSARLFYAYADNLLAAGRESDALQWFVHAVDADEDGLTDAAARIAELTGEDADDGIAFGEEELAALIGPDASSAEVPLPVDSVPAADAPVDDAPVDDTPVEDAPVDEVPAEQAPVDEVLVDEVPDDQVPVEPALSAQDVNGDQVSAAVEHEDPAPVLDETPAAGDAETTDEPDRPAGDDEGTGSR